MDTSVGRGGDLNKYARSSNNASFFLALDMSSDVNKAAKEILSRTYEKTTSHVCTIRYKSVNQRGQRVCPGSEKSKKQNTHYLDTPVREDRQIPKEMRQIVPRFKNLGQRGFNIISSQFSFHYYLKDEETFRG